MFLDWWMLLAFAVWWFASLWDIKRTAYNDGVSGAVDMLISDGYIKLDDNDEVIGLCNIHKHKPPNKES